MRVLLLGVVVCHHGYEDSFDYEISYIEGSGKINIKLVNNCKNEQGEYIASFIENGTGIYSTTGTTRPEGWWYPSRESDQNPLMYNDPLNPFSGTKKQLANGDYIAFTYGQVPKPILRDSLDIIKKELDTWIEEYYERRGV